MSYCICDANEANSNYDEGVTVIQQENKWTGKKIIVRSECHAHPFKMSITSHETIVCFSCFTRIKWPAGHGVVQSKSCGFPDGEAHKGSDCIGYIPSVRDYNCVKAGAAAEKEQQSFPRKCGYEIADLINKQKHAIHSKPWREIKWGKLPAVAHPTS